MGANHHPKAHSHRFLKGWKRCWGKFGCFVPEKLPSVVAQPTFKSMQEDIDNGSLILDSLGQAVMLPPVMCAPPSSPASVTLFTLFRVTSGRFPGQIGQQMDTFTPFMLENTLVTPPIFSTSTTTPATPLSTAPFTPLPELAHLTTPSSPEVPFAHLLASSFESKCSLSNHNNTWCKYPDTEKGLPLPPTGFELFYQLYPYSSCMARVASSRSGGSSSGTASPFPEKLFLDNDDAIADDTAKESWPRNVAFGGFVPKLMVDETAIELEHVESRHVRLGLIKNVEGRRSCELVQKVENGGSRKLMSDQTVGIDHLEDHQSIDAFGLGVANTNIEGDQCCEPFAEESGGICCCSKCSELSRTCQDLSEALKQTKEKLTMLEKRVDVLDDKERKLQQLIQWLQLGAKLQHDNTIAHLSKEESAHFDLQDCSGETGNSNVQGNT